MSTSLIIAVYALLTLAGFVGAATFVVMYGLRSPDWAGSDIGRNLMAKTAILAALLAMSLINLVVRVPAWLILVGMAALDAVIWWRVAILRRMQRRQASEVDR